MDNDSEYKRYWAVKYTSGDILVQIYHPRESRKSIESAYKNKLIEKITSFFYANCRESAELIALDELENINYKKELYAKVY